MAATLAPPRRKRANAPVTSFAPGSTANGAFSQVNPDFERDQLLVITDASWGMYLDLDTKFQGTRTRLTYFHRRIDIMTLSTDHERIKGNLHDLIVAHCQDEAMDYVSEGSATLRIDYAQGKEPDDSFVFGTETKPRPDMVLEVVRTSAAIDKLEFHAPLRIPEVWIWESSGLSVFLLDGARYRRVKKSRLLPRFDIPLAGTLATSARTSQAVREFRKKTR